MVACLGLIMLWGYPGRLHEICVYSTEFIEPLYPHQFKKWLFLEFVQMRRFTMLACPGVMHVALN